MIYPTTAPCFQQKISRSSPFLVGGTHVRPCCCLAGSSWLSPCHSSQRIYPLYIQWGRGFINNKQPKKLRVGAEQEWVFRPPPTGAGGPKEKFGGRWPRGGERQEEQKAMVPLRANPQLASASLHVLSPIPGNHQPETPGRKRGRPLGSRPGVP